jgi:hypothetical protein
MPSSSSSSPPLAAAIAGISFDYARFRSQTFSFLFSFSNEKRAESLAALEEEDNSQRVVIDRKRHLSLVVYIHIYPLQDTSLSLSLSLFVLRDVIRLTDWSIKIFIFFYFPNDWKRNIDKCKFKRE